MAKKYFKLLSGAQNLNKLAGSLNFQLRIVILSRVRLSDKKLPLWCVVLSIDFIVTGSDLADNLTKLTVHL